MSINNFYIVTVVYRLIKCLVERISERQEFCCTVEFIRQVTLKRKIMLKKEKLTLHYLSNKSRANVPNYFTRKNYLKYYFVFALKFH